MTSGQSQASIFDVDDKVNNVKPKSIAGLTAFGIVTGVTAGLFVFTTPFISPALRKICLPYVPASSKQIRNVIKALHSPSKLGHTLVDIGSGDGRIVLEAAKYGYHGMGYELNLWLVVYSKFQALLQKGKISGSANFKRVDLWKAEYAQYDNAVVFGVDQMMPRLEKKLLQEMQPGTKLVVCRFPFPNLEVSATHGEGVDTVWTYFLPKVVTN
uniref:Protein N-lysine methyltransferase FAM173B n=1 Tax=Ciona intestinalis TaxID=7719 RepID=F6PII0_CIOIN|nr:protein N-lysine methyltransferase FAM173B [Ciona intestinalis]|eukprot:XP_002125222.1 protein N-lysine methyltransferase FAM173B [Ciona intestinalis]